MAKCADFEWSEVGQRIRARRLALNRTQQQLAGKAGLTQNAIFRLEAGDTNPQISTLRVVARALGANVRELVCGVADTEPRFSDRLVVVRRILESGDDAAIRAMDYGLENAQTVLDRTRGIWDREPALLRIGGRTYRRSLPVGSEPLKAKRNDAPSESQAKPLTASHPRRSKTSDSLKKEIEVMTGYQLGDAPHLPAGTGAKVTVPKSSRSVGQHEHSSEFAARKNSASSQN